MPPKTAVEPFKSRARAERSARLRDLRQGILALNGISAAAVSEIVNALDKAADYAEGWRFVQLDPVAYTHVLRLLDRHSSRPRLAVRLLGMAMEKTSSMSQEILATRAEMAAECEAAPPHISTALRELERLGVIWREPGESGRSSRLILNPRLATRLGGMEREHAQANAPPITDPDAPPPAPAKKPGGRPALRLVPAAE